MTLSRAIFYSNGVFTLLSQIIVIEDHTVANKVKSQTFEINLYLQVNEMGPNLDSKSVEKIESLAKTMDRELSSVEAKIVASMLQVVHLESIFNWLNLFGLT